MSISEFRGLWLPNLHVFIWYAIRRRFFGPASDGERCIMGAPVHPALWCPRAALPDDELWCKRHHPGRQFGGSLA